MRAALPYNPDFTRTGNYFMHICRKDTSNLDTAEALSRLGYKKIAGNRFERQVVVGGVTLPR